MTDLDTQFYKTTPAHSRWDAEAKALRAENDRLREALTPSGFTKYAYMGEVICACGGSRHHHVPWVSVKEVMAMIRARAALGDSE